MGGIEDHNAGPPHHENDDRLALVVEKSQDDSQEVSQVDGMPTAEG